MNTRRFDRFGKAVAVGSIGIGVLAGCSQEVSGQPVPETTQTISGDTADDRLSIEGRTPKDMNPTMWCAYEVARIAITDILTDKDVVDIGDGYYRNDQGTAAVQETSIGYVYRLETMAGESSGFAVRGEWSLQSHADTALSALDPAVFSKDALRINSSAPIAVWNLDSDTGGTAIDRDNAEVCIVAQEAVNSIEK